MDRMFNRISRLFSHNRPLEQPAVDHDDISQTHKANTKAKATPQPTPVPDLPEYLPYGWEKHYASPAFPYYVDQLTGTIRLVRPKGSRQAMFLSQQAAPADLTAFPGYLSAEVSYSILIEQFISIYRGPKERRNLGSPLPHLLLDRNRSRDASRVDLIKPLEDILQSDISEQTRRFLDPILVAANNWQHPASGRQEAEVANILETTCTLWFAPAQGGPSTSSATTNPSNQLSGCEACVESPLCHHTHAQLQASHAWCYLCMSDFDQGDPIPSNGSPLELTMRSCGHLFHAACFKQYVRNQPTLCPLCPQTLPPTEAQSSRAGPSNRSQATPINHETVSVPSSSSPHQAVIAHPLSTNTSELARLQQFGQTYRHEHTARIRHEEEEQRQRERARHEQERLERERLEAERLEFAKQERIHLLNQLPLMLYIPAPRADEALSSSERWEGKWVVSGLPFLQLDENRAGCYICMMDFDEPRREDLSNGEDEEPEPVRLLPCNHACHQSCIDTWVIEHETVCPYCRKEITPVLWAEGLSALDELSLPALFEEA